MSTEEVLGPASVLRQAVNRSRMLEAARSKDILVEVIADRDGYLDTQSVDWETYWRPHDVGLSTAGRQQLDELQHAREAYLASAFDLANSGAYCYRYFRLLRSALCGTIGQPGPLFLRALSGLEIFGVRGFRDKEPLAAGAINVRQAGWLLGRLRWPRAQAAPKFLPLACLPPSIAGRDWPARLFYHYRQISLEADAGLSLLVYPAVSLSERPVSFEPIERLTAALRAKPDPWSRRRAKQIADGAIGPFLASCATRLRGPPAVAIAFVDVCC